MTDTHGATGTATTTALVANVAPSATFEAPVSVVAGQDIVLKLSAPSDPSAADTAAGFEYAFDRGDGSGLGAYTTTATVTCPTSASGVPAPWRAASATRTAAPPPTRPPWR